MTLIAFMNNDKENYTAIFIEIIFPRLFSDIKQYYRFQLTGINASRRSINAQWLQIHAVDFDLMNISCV